MFVINLKINKKIGKKNIHGNIMPMKERSYTDTCLIVVADAATESYGTSKRDVECVVLSPQLLISRNHEVLHPRTSSLS